MFEKSLVDLVKGIRNAGNDATAYISKSVQDIKDELKNRDVTIKAQALQKLIYVSRRADWRAGGARACALAEGAASLGATQPRAARSTPPPLSRPAQDARLRHDVGRLPRH
jgi:hypothetical protein